MNEEWGDTDQPKHKDFVESIEKIKIATLKSFWTDEKVDFPEQESEVWWEIWIRSHSEKEKYEVSSVESVTNQLRNVGVFVSEEILEFPEHKVILARGTAKELSNSLLLLNNLSEIRKAKTRADFFTDFISGVEQEDWVDDLLERLDIQNEDGPVICLLDSGVRNTHPLLAQIIPNTKLDAYKQAWGTDDSVNNTGHGTLMAGIAIYDDLTPILVSPNAVEIFHGVESVKMIDNSQPNDPENYGAITEECVARSFIIDPDSYKIFCMAISTEDFRDLGQPSSWSSAIDKITFGELEEESQKQFFLSGGNVYINESDEYPDKNLVEQVHDPGQSWNSLTVGTYTQKTDIDFASNPTYSPLARSGQMAPTNSTSFLWKNQWPYKPDVVFEGGNLADDGTGNAVYDDSLQLLSTSKNHTIRPLASFGATSAATASASKFAANINIQYPEFWPETNRALIVHSAGWTNEMLNNRDLSEIPRNHIENITRQVGYGVPNLQRALYSASNSLTLITQNTFKPYRLVGNKVKTDQIHLHNLPWPREALLELAELDVQLKITLSYYIEPNPGKRYYSSKFYYQSHGLRFDVIRVNESVEDFVRRKNREARSDDYDGTDTDPEKWLFGVRNRTKGSIHKDVWFGTAADLATKNYIVIYPVTGWWRTRKSLERYTNSVRYSLIATIETPPSEVDIYNPVYNQVAIEV